MLKTASSIYHLCLEDQQASCLEQLLACIYRTASSMYHLCLEDQQASCLAQREPLAVPVCARVCQGGACARVVCVQTHTHTCIHAYIHLHTHILCMYVCGKSKKDCVYMSV
jgi:hypothetical protein